VDIAIAVNDKNRNNEDNATIASATLVEELITADITDIPVIIPTTTLDDDNNRSNRLIVLTLSLLGVVGIYFLFGCKCRGKLNQTEWTDVR